jgi:hypothetical protein
MNPNFCKHLRTKKMYIPAQADEVFNASPEELANTEHCWCNRTMAGVGPDDRQVNAHHCSRATRSCFEE